MARPFTRWNPARVVAEIQSRHAQGLPLNRGAAPPTLVRAGRLWIGSWVDALRAAGLDPDQIRKNRGKPPRFTAEWVVQEIRRRDAGGERIAMPHVGHRLVNAAKRRFGSWKAALRAAGFASYKETRWYKAHPQFRKRSGQLAPHRTRFWNLPHCLAGRRCRDEAIRQARESWGRVRREVRSGWRWRPSPALVLQLIRSEYGRGAWLGGGIVAVGARWIYREGIRHFGSWKQALLEAGVPEIETRLMRVGWTPVKVVKAIRELTPTKILRIGERPPVAPTLYYQARRWFGTWNRAVAASKTKRRIVETRRVLS